jgi:hypothetical protein
MYASIKLSAGGLLILAAASVIFISCRKDRGPVLQENHKPEYKIAAKEKGATQLSGVGFYAATDECDYLSRGAFYAIRMTGDLEGCLYAFIDSYDCSPGGTYREKGREFFEGTYKGKAGSFWTTYQFEAKYEGCADSGAPLGAEIFGRCQHPIVKGSGTGVFAGVSGRLDFKDDIEAGNFPYRGHLGF